MHHNSKCNKNVFQEQEFNKDVSRQTKMEFIINRSSLEKFLKAALQKERKYF